MSPLPSPDSAIAFILELDKLKGVLRKNKPITLERYENSAEHSWQVAMLAMSMQPYANEPVDINKVIKLLLVHDIGELSTRRKRILSTGFNVLSGSFRTSYPPSAPNYS